MNGKTGKYLYGIVKLNCSNNFKPVQNNSGEKIYCLDHNKIGCVVKDAIQKDLLTQSKEDIAGNLVEHQQTIEKIMKDHDIIPIKFGTFLDDNSEVLSMLSKGEELFSELMYSVQDKIELDVTAVWHDLNSIIKEIGEQEQSIVDFKRKVEENPPDDLFQAGLQVGAMVKTVLDDRREELQKQIIDQLSGSSLQFQTHDLMEDKMIMNCAFLLETNAESAFDHTLHELDKVFEDQIDFRCVGPLPAYSFATCEVIKADSKQTERARRLLDLNERAGPVEIKAAYRKLIKSEHPDRSKSAEAVERFEAIKSAWDYLMNIADGKEISFKENDLRQNILVRPFDVAGTRTYNR